LPFKSGENRRHECFGAIYFWPYGLTVRPGFWRGRVMAKLLIFVGRERKMYLRGNRPIDYIASKGGVINMIT
jgi:hypothetical protein